ncbi:MAG: hypothetical protein DYG89_06110 [Caldilinea sp. CFX5]|nr:hypothetical protein [Caldilinea sp. CFX5]
MNQQATVPDPQLLLTPATAPVDEPIAIRVIGLQASEEVTIAAALSDDDGKRWQAQARFRADEHGVIDLTTQPPLAGSYSGVDGMGLFWSMAIDPTEPDGTSFKKRTAEPLPVTFQVERDGQVVATALLDWRCLSSSVTRTPVRADGLVGTFFVPTAGGPYPGVLIFGGSGGGLSEVQAALLARQGYATLALAYFAYEDLPPALHNIPLEYVDGRRIKGGRLPHLSRVDGAARQKITAAEPRITRQPGPRLFGCPLLRRHMKSTFKTYGWTFVKVKFQSRGVRTPTCEARFARGRANSS